MTHALVTGCAGFIGSHLTEKLLEQGYMVTGIDVFLDNYHKDIKKYHMSAFIKHPSFRFIEGDLTQLDLYSLLGDVDVIFHQSAIPGVRTSWGKQFQDYARHNILATQILLEATRANPVKKIIYASSSSIYGETEGMVKEDRIPAPVSPYGVSKLSGEHLCSLYHVNFQTPVVMLRYFTVYGPRQRPDMAFHRFIRQSLIRQPIAVYGDGTQTRDFTFVEDVVRANLLAVEKGKDGEIYNIGGKNPVSIKYVLQMIEEITGKSVDVNFLDPVPGDPKHTRADISKAEKQLGYQVTWDIRDGLREEVKYVRNLYAR